MLHLYIELIIVMAISMGCEFGPNMIGIQEGCNKNFHVDHGI